MMFTEANEGNEGEEHFDCSRSVATLPLAPGVSRVTASPAGIHRFSGLSHDVKPLKRLPADSPSITRLKPGADERAQSFGIAFRDAARRGVECAPISPLRVGAVVLFPLFPPVSFDHELHH
jgi:hypothetical protein